MARTTVKKSKKVARKNTTNTRSCCDVEAYCENHTEAFSTVTASYSLYGSKQPSSFTIQGFARARANPVYPSYCVLTRMLELSLEDYRLALRPEIKEEEIEFWRGPRFTYYATLLIEMERLLFGREFSLQMLRRGAEKKMKLPAGHLEPQVPLSDSEVDDLTARISQQFQKIVDTVGHVPDPSADRRFLPRQPPKRKATVSHIHSINSVSTLSEPSQIAIAL